MFLFEDWTSAKHIFYKCFDRICTYGSKGSDNVLNMIIIEILAQKIIQEALHNFQVKLQSNDLYNNSIWIPLTLWSTLLSVNISNTREQCILWKLWIFFFYKSSSMMLKYLNTIFSILKTFLLLAPIWKSICYKHHDFA